MTPECSAASPGQVCDFVCNEFFRVMTIHKLCIQKFPKLSQSISMC